MTIQMAQPRDLNVSATFTLGTDVPTTPSTALSMQVTVPDGVTLTVNGVTVPGAPPVMPPAPIPTAAATFLGTTGEDLVGQSGSLGGNGVPDWHIRVQNARTDVSSVTITSGNGGTWVTPNNGTNWLIATANPSAGTLDLFFEPWNGTDGQTPPGQFTVVLRYADGTSATMTVSGH
ncbi:MAG TPA: hypothetical protein VMT97_14800 [Terriglobales bacterium]|nr:hypothetical protein [Terriglobales bacterium]